MTRAMSGPGHAASARGTTLTQTSASVVAEGASPRVERDPIRRGTIGAAAPIAAARADIPMYAPRHEPLVVLGQTGVGKSMLVHELHALGGPGRPLVTVSGGELSEGLYQSQLYGHVRGAFTGAVGSSVGFFGAAAGGTLFIDELHLIKLPVQGALLRALQEGTWTPLGGNRELRLACRFVFATHRALDDLVEDGTLLLDLRWRLGEAVIVLPSLMDRLEDLPELAEQFLARRAEELRGPSPAEPMRFSVEVMAQLVANAWPGNVRELENVVRDATLRAMWRNALLVELHDLPVRFRADVNSGALRPERRRIVVEWASRRRATTRAEIGQVLEVSTATVDLDRRQSNKAT